MALVLPPLYPILDASCLPGEGSERDSFLDRVVRELRDAGVTLLQLRLKGWEREALLRAAAVVRAAAPADMLLILNDHAELVTTAGFDGVHLGQGDEPVEQARARMGIGALVGLSTHTREQVEAGERTGADYLAIGPVFETTSKPDAAAAVGIVGVQAARAATARPLVAIGGMRPGNAVAVWQAGADTVAVIGAVFAEERAQAGSAARLAGDFLKLFR